MCVYTHLYTVDIYMYIHLENGRLQTAQEKPEESLWSFLTWPQKSRPFILLQSTHGRDKTLILSGEVLPRLKGSGYKWSLNIRNVKEFAGVVLKHDK